MRSARAEEVRPRCEAERGEARAVAKWDASKPSHRNYDGWRRMQVVGTGPVSQETDRRPKRESTQKRDQGRTVQAEAQEQ